MLQKTNERLLKCLNALSKRYPQAWEQVAHFIEDKGKDLPNWPNWCFLPLSAFYAIVSGGGENRLDLNTIKDVAILGALGTWRYTQGIYKFEQSVLDAISSTTLKGDLPIEVLLRLPEWCLYIETPTKNDQHGFWAHLEYDVNTNRKELRFLLDQETGLTPLILHLGDWTVTEAIDRMVSEALKQISINRMHIAQEELTNMIESLAETAQCCIAPLLYLCSDEPDIARIENDLPVHPKPVKTKKGLRFFPPDKPKIWEIGQTLAKKLAMPSEYDSQLTRNGPKPHIRKAHWHGYWVGQKDSQARNFIYKWLPPLVINAESLK